MPPRKRDGAAAGSASKSQCQPQIFAGLLLFAHGSVGGSEVILEARVNERGGKLLRHAFVMRHPLTPAEPATHAVISNNCPLDDELVAALRTQACNQAAIIVRQQYLSDCVTAGKLLPVPAYAARLAAPPAPAAVPLPRRIEPESDDEDAPSAFAAPVDDFVPPPPTGDRCSACQTELLWCEIATCQACLKTFTNRGDNARLRALHLRFRVNHPNKAIVAALFELCEYEYLYGEKVSSDSFAKAASMLKAMPRSISCVGDLDLFDPPFVGSKTRLYLPQLLDGKCERLDNFRKDPKCAAVCSMARLPYVGAKLAKSWAERGWLTPQAVLANLPHDEAANLSSWQKLVLTHADELLLPIHEADRAPLVAAVEAAAREAEVESGCRGSLKWQFVGGTARGKTGSHDLDFLFTHDEEGDEVGMLGKMLQALARSEALERDPATGKPRLAVVLSSGAGGDAQDGRAADSRGLEGVRAWDPGAVWLVLRFALHCGAL
jgi:DNA polymerase/3'-5' exonuclease PolX